MVVAEDGGEVGYVGSDVEVASSKMLKVENGYVEG